MREFLTELCETPYFSKDTQEYNKGILSVIDYVIDNYNSISYEYLRQIRISIWKAAKYLSGSISSEIPYEVTFALGKALQDWLGKEFIITTALSTDKDFHFFPYDPWKELNLLLPDFEYPGFDKILIQICLPKLYKHIPLYNVALYHELGHFVDTHYKIVDSTFLINPLVPQKNIDLKTLKYIETNHRAEIFADLFAACYTGDANYKFLEDAAYNHPPSDTHPATDFRIEISKKFLKGNPTQIIDMYQNALSLRKLPQLDIKFDIPDLAESFNSIRPYAIKSERELHGMMQASWNFLADSYDSNEEPWVSIDQNEITRIINDLTEKSIRNKAIVDKWQDGTA